MVKLRLRSEGLVWLIGAMVCLLAAPWVQSSVSTGSGWPQCAAAALNVKVPPRAEAHRAALISVSVA